MGMGSTAATMHLTGAVLPDGALREDEIRSMKSIIHLCPCYTTAFSVIPDLQELEDLGLGNQMEKAIAHVKRFAHQGTSSSTKSQRDQSELAIINST